MSRRSARKTAWRPPPWVLPAVVGVGLAGLTAWAWEPRDTMEPHVAEGNRAFAQRDWPGALTHYEGAPGNGVRNAGVYMNRGLARRRYGVALEVFSVGDEKNHLGAPRRPATVACCPSSSPTRGFPRRGSARKTRCAARRGGSRA